MKRLSLLLVFVLFVSLFSTTSYADSKTYALEDLGMTIDIPDHYEVATENLTFDEERLKDYGDLGDMVLSSDSAAIPLDAWDYDAGLEIAVTVADNVLGDYNQFSDTTLLTLASATESVIESVGGQVLSTSIFQGAQAKFVKYVSVMPMTDAPSMNDHLIQYNTVYNGKTVNVTLHSYRGELSDSACTEIEDVAKSVRFFSNPVSAPEAEQTSSFIYTDQERGVSFSVPDNWKEEPLYKDREVLKAKFASTQEQGLLMFYGYIDFYPIIEELDLDDEVSRDMLNQSFFSAEEMTELLSLAAESSDQMTELPEVTVVRYGEHDFFKVMTKGSAEAYGLNISTTMTVLYHFDHGYLYQFQFSGTEDSPYYADFEKLVSSVNYQTELVSGANYQDKIPGLVQQRTESDAFHPCGLDYGMSPEKVHDVLGKMPDLTENIDGYLYEYFSQDYKMRPLGFDRNGKWMTSSDFYTFVVLYDLSTTNPSVAHIYFYVENSSGSDNYLDMVFDYCEALSMKYGSPGCSESDLGTLYRWCNDGLALYLYIDLNGESTQITIVSELDS